MSLSFDRINKVIQVNSPDTEITVQELLNGIREYEDELTSIDLPQIAYASGKEELGGGVTVGITLMLMDWKVKFEARAGPDWVVCNVSGGNLVCYDTTLATYVTPIEPSAYVTATLTASSSATTSDLDAIQYSSYQNAVWVDVEGSNTGTAYPMGTREYPLNNIIDAVSVANTKGFSTLQILSDMTIDSGTVLTGFELVGKSHVDTLIIMADTASCQNVTIRNCNIAGILDGGTIIQSCMVGDMVYFNGHIHDSGLYGDIQLGGSADAVIANCYTVDQDYPPSVDMGGSGQSLAMPNYSGMITISNLISDSEEIGIGLNAGQITLDSSITAGTIVISGIGILNDNTTGTASVNTDGLLNKQEITKPTWSSVYIDTVSGTAGTAFPIGTSSSPCSNLADALTIANSLNIKEIYFKGELTLASSYSNFKFKGYGSIPLCKIDMNNQELDDVVFESCLVTGHENAVVVGGEGWQSSMAKVQFKDCYLYEVEDLEGTAIHCQIEGATLIKAGGWLSSIETVIEGDYTVFNMRSTADTTVSMDMNSGWAQFINAVEGCLIELNVKGGEVTLDSSCTGGSYYLEGIGTLYNDSAMTKIDNHFVWDEMIANHTETGSTGEALSDAGSAGNPWSTPISGNTDSGTFGELVGKKLLTLAKWLGLR